MNRAAITERIENRIYTIRGQKVMLNSDLASLWENLRSQIVTFKNDIRKFKPYAFTEYGVLKVRILVRRAISIKAKQIYLFHRNYSKKTAFGG